MKRIRNSVTIEFRSAHLNDEQIIDLALANLQYIPRGHVRVLDHGESRPARRSVDLQTLPTSKNRFSVQRNRYINEPRIIAILAEHLGHTEGRGPVRGPNELGNLGDGQHMLWQQLNKKARNSMTQTLRSIDQRLHGRSIDHSVQNCRKAYAVKSTLQNVVKGLEFDKTRSKCDWTVEACHQRDSAALEQWLQAKSEMCPTEPVRNSPQALNQMIRMTTWMLAEIEDELRSLIIAKRMQGDEWRTKKREFIRKWGDEIQPYSAICINLNHQRIKEDTDAESLLANTLTDSQIPWTSVVTYWDVLYRSFRDNSTIRETVGGKAQYDFDLHTIQDVFHDATPGLALQKQVGERCVRNVELVERVMCSFQLEIFEELERRKRCTHAPPHKCHHSTTKTLNKTLGFLRKMREEIGKIATKIRQIRVRPFRYTDDDFKLLMDWGSLDGNSYRQLIGLTSDELVARLVEQPIPEDAITEKDDLVKSIETGLLQTRTDAIIATRQEEYQRAKGQA